MSNQTCVSEQDLRDYVLGELPDGVDSQVAAHIEACPACERAVARLDGLSDPLLKSLRRALGPRAQATPAASETLPLPCGDARADGTARPNLAAYEVLEELGRGGMGVVWRARDSRLGRVVALKLMKAGADARPEVRNRFQREATAMACLQHPGIVQIFDVGEQDGVPFLALEFVPGESLAQRLGRAPLPARSAAELLEGLAQAVAYAHQRGVLHRDLTPANVLVTADGKAKITDFGLARLLSDGAALTLTGAVMGTPSYLSPEQADGQARATGSASDVYALGAILYECLTGRPPFRAATVLETLAQVVHDEPVSPRQLQPKVPRDLNTICLKCLCKEPGQRYTTALELADDLRRFLDGQPIRARPTGPVERLWRWCRRNPALAGLTATVAFLLVTMTIGSNVLSLSLRKALDESVKANADARQANNDLEKTTAEVKETNLKLEKANANANAQLWQSYLSHARASRMTRQPGQRFESLRAIDKALRLPLPPNRSLDELRTEAIAALCLPDLETATEWDGVSEGCTAFAIDPAFERYAWGDKAGNVFVRRVEDNADLFHLPGSASIAVYAGLEWSPDGRFLHQLCEGMQAGSSRVWQLDGPQPVPVLKDEHVGFAFRPDSRQCAAWYPDGSIRLYDLPSGKLVNRFDSGLEGWCRLVWNPRHDLLGVYVYNGNVWRVLDVNTGDVKLERKQPNLKWADWHPDGNLLAVGTIDPTGPRIYLWDIRTNQLACPPLQGHKTAGLVFHFNHAGDRLVSNDWSNMLRVWDTRTGRQLLAHSVGGVCMQFRGDDGLLAADVSSRKVRLLRCHTGQEFRTLIDYPPKSAGKMALGGVALVHSAGRLVALESTTGIVLADLEQGKQVALLPLPGGNHPLRFDPADDSLWTYGSNGVLRWPIRADPEKPQELGVGPPERLSEVAIQDKWGSSPDGKVVAIPNYARGALLWQRDLRRFLPLGPQDDVRSCSVSSDGFWVATGTHDSKGNGARAKVWDGRSGQHVADLSVAPHCKVGFSPDGKWLLTTGGAFRLWEVGTWREHRTLGESTYNDGFAFSSDGKLLALGDAAPGVVRLVDPDTGREVARLIGPEPTRLHPLCFSPDGAQLITFGSESLEVHLFDLRAIRKQLKERDLDWDAPPLPDAPHVRSEPLRVEVNMGNFLQQVEADRLVASANRLTNEKKHAESRAALRQAITIDPTHARAHNNLAWQLLIGPKDLRDAKAALPLARKAVELAPRESLYLNTLGVALYYNGAFEEAVPVLEKSLAAGQGRQDAFDLFFLAMSHARLGDLDKAKDCFDKAVKWTEAQKKLPEQWAEELKTFRAEAESVLATPGRPEVRHRQTNPACANGWGASAPCSTCPVLSPVLPPEAFTVTDARWAENEMNAVARSRIRPISCC